MKGMCAIVLAAGESKRMGSPKMLLSFRDRTVIETVLDNVIAAGIEEVILVLGKDMDKIKDKTEDYQVSHCYNEKYKSGMLSSVKCGFAHLPADCRAALVMPGDQPMIAPEEIKRVVKAFNRSGKGLAMPVYNGKRGHPLIVDARYFDEIRNLPDTEGLRRLAIIHPDDVHEVKTRDPMVLLDIDTREDYLLAMNKI